LLNNLKKGKYGSNHRRFSDQMVGFRAKINGPIW
jgi:hypothetical protein